MELPTDKNGFILFDTLSAKIKNYIKLKLCCNGENFYLLWHQIKEY